MPSPCTGFSDTCLVSIAWLLQKPLHRGTKSAWRSGALKRVQIAGWSARIWGSRQAHASADSSLFILVHTGTYKNGDVWLYQALEA